MSKKQIYSRLDDFFTNLEETAIPQPGEISAGESSWQFQCDPQGRLTSCTSQVTDFLGYTPEQIVGRHLTELAHPKTADSLRHTLNNGSTQAEIQGKWQHTQGSWVEVSIHLEPLKDTDGGLLGWRVTNRPLPSPSLPSAPAAAAAPAPEKAPAARKKPARPTSPPVRPSEQPIFAPTPAPAAPTYPVHPLTLETASKPLTPAGMRSLQEFQLIIQNAGANEPAALAVPFRLGEQHRGLLEIVDEQDRKRTWTDDERALVQEVANQLGLAIENAQLYAVVQQELAQKVKAEQETLRRNRDLAALNRVGQELSRLTDQNAIIQTLHSTIDQLASAGNLIIAISDPQTRQLTFPVHSVDGQHNDEPPAPMAARLFEHTFTTRRPLVLQSGVIAFLTEQNIPLPIPVPASLAAIPMLAAERAVGGILIQNFETENAFPESDLELLSTIASQATTALENANLFNEIRGALEAIENRERYQANVTRAVAYLSESGTRALPEVLEALGQAAQCSRVYYAQIQEDPSGMHWRAVAEWINPETPTYYERGASQHLPTALFSHWAAALREKNMLATTQADCPHPELEYLSSQQIQSTLLLAVPGKTAIPSFIGFDQVDRPRRWLNEEISVLRVSTDALANTIVREDLLEQLQVSLDETEHLYKASHRLALANDMQEMVAAISMALHTPVINRVILALFEEDSSGNVEHIRVAASWYSNRGAPPPENGTEYDLAIYGKFLRTPNAAFMDDINHQPMDETLREELKRNNIRSLAMLPLWAGKHQLGAILMLSEERHHFSGLEIRSYPPLVDQMATSVENARLFQQTQEALAESEQLYKIASGIAQAASTEELITLIAETVLPENAERVSVSEVINNEEGEPIEIVLVGFHDRQQKYQRMGMRISHQSLPVIRNMTQDALVIDNMATTPLVDDVSRRTFLRLDIISGITIPLRSAGRLVGLLTISSHQPTSFSKDDVHILQVAGAGIAVALEKQRLLQEAQRRALELQAAAEIARDTTSTLALDALLARIVNLVCQRFNYEHASIFLLDESSNYAVVREATGEAGAQMKASGHRHAVGSRSIIGTVMATGEPVIVNDVFNSLIHVPNPLLPNTRSEIGLPLRIGDRVMGALDIQSNHQNAFAPNDVAVLQILADQIAVAIDNAQAYELTQKAIRDMQEVDRLKSQFLANMSHELRTPLNSIIGFSRVILKGIDGPINEIQTQDLTAIYNSGQHLLNLINDILDLSKIEAGKMELSFADVDLNDLVNSVLSTAIGLVKDKPIKLQHNLPVNLPLIYADPTRVRQVLLNLISNAAKFTEEGSITVELSTVTSPDNRPEVMVAVVDTGAGIAPEDTVKLFQPFSQVDDSPTRKTGGTGLGLSICRSFIEMHGGRIGLLRSEVGVGSTFFFTLPIPVKEIPIPAPETASDEKAVILSIDDDAQVISLYQRYLSPHGYSVIPLTDPKQAVEEARKLKPMAITLDIMMPEKDGWSVLHDLKNDPETRQIPVIICSILEQEEKGFSLGASDYLTKPFLHEDLIAAISRLNRDEAIHTILIIDDDPDDQRLAQKMLEDSGKFQLTTADSGTSGWEMIQQNRPDAVIMDLFMPEMDGFTLLSKLRSDPNLRTLPVLVISGVDLTAEQHAQLAEFGQQLLTKGYLRESELLDHLESALHKLRSTNHEKEA